MKKIIIAFGLVLVSSVGAMSYEEQQAGRYKRWLRANHISYKHEIQNDELAKFKRSYFNNFSTPYSLKSLKK